MVTVKKLIAAKQAENAQTTQYTATNVTTIIDKFSVHNTTGAPVTIAVNLVASGGAAGAGNLFLNKSIAGGETYICPELVGQVLGNGDFISTLAGAATSLSISASGREIS